MSLVTARQISPNVTVGVVFAVAMFDDDRVAGSADL